MIYNGENCKNVSIFIILYIIYRGEIIMNKKILLLLSIIVVIGILLIVNSYFRNTKEDIKVPILLYHNFELLFLNFHSMIITTSILQKVLKRI